MFAIIQTGGKQYKVNEGDVIFVEKLGVAEGEDVKFENVLAVSFAQLLRFFLMVALNTRRRD